LEVSAIIQKAFSAIPRYVQSPGKGITGSAQWLDESGTMVIERPVRITLFSLGVAFLHSIGADGTAAIAGLTAIMLNKGAPSAGGKSKPTRSRSSGR